MKITLKMRVSNFVAKICKFVPDRWYVAIKYKMKTGRRVNFDRPERFTDKIQCLKLDTCKADKCTKYVDKFAVRKFVAEAIGAEYLIPLVGGPWKCVEEIDFSTLPNQFVMKCNHDSGGLYICKEKENINVKQIRRYFKWLLKRNYYLLSRERPYKNIERCIYAEKYMQDESLSELKDYKLFLFGGKVKLIEVDYARFVNHHRNFYDIEWNFVPFSVQYPNDPSYSVEKPRNLQEMIECAEKIADKILEVNEFLRVDFYNISGKLYFGEITFYHGSGFEAFTPDEWDEVLGGWLDITDVELL